VEEVLAMLHGWFKEGIIHPDFVLGTAGQATAAFEQGRVGYLGLASINDLNESRPNSLVNRMRRIHPSAEIVAGPALRRAGGVPMTRVWGAAAHVAQFSSATEPEKVIRVLKLLEELARDGEFAIEATLGQRGEHWDHDAKSGVRLLEPYTDQLARSEMLSTEAFLMPPFFGLLGLSEEKVASLYSEDQVEVLRQVARPEWGLRNALGKSDVLDLSASKLRDLRVLQETRFVDMIRGRRPVASFHDFVDTWKSRGGAEMLREANEFIEQRSKVYREVGVLP